MAQQALDNFCKIRDLDSPALRICSQGTASFTTINCWPKGRAVRRGVASIKVIKVAAASLWIWGTSSPFQSQAQLMCTFSERKEPAPPVGEASADTIAQAGPGVEPTTQELSPSIA